MPMQGPNAPAQQTAEEWDKKVFRPFLHAEREYMILSAIRYWYANSPVKNRKEFDACYFEFGCYSGNTLTCAWRHTRHLFNFHYVAFDSFEGLPDISTIDKSGIWDKGSYRMSIEDFRAVLLQAEMPAERVTVIPGFYEQSLNANTRSILAGRSAAIVYVDCDLYQSTVPVLEFITDYLQKGTVIIFDDWCCFHGDPLKGERRAWSEFTRRHSHLRFEPLAQTSMQKSFVYLGTSE